MNENGLYEYDRIIYVESSTGQILHDTGFIQTTDADFEDKRDNVYETVKELAERVRESITEYRIKPGEYERDFIEGYLDRIDIETGELLFIYPEPSTGEPTEPQTPLSKQLEDMKEMLYMQEAAMIETAILLAGEQEKNTNNEMALMETAVLLYQEQQRNDDNERAIMELAKLLEGGTQSV